MLLRQNPTVHSWIDIVISHMYPAESSVERRKGEVKERRVDSQHHTIKVLVSFFARIKGHGQPLSASGEMKKLSSV
jgi:hypothetical protein